MVSKHCVKLGEPRKACAHGPKCLNEGETFGAFGNRMSYSLRQSAPKVTSLMKISVLVHNSVLRDARVLKQAKTLSAAGHDVDIHGISASGIYEEHSLIGTNARIFLHPKISEHYAKPTAPLVRASECTDPSQTLPADTDQGDLQHRKRLLDVVSPKRLATIILLGVVTIIVFSIFRLIDSIGYLIGQQQSGIITAAALFPVIVLIYLQRGRLRSSLRGHHLNLKRWIAGGQRRLNRFLKALRVKQSARQHTTSTKKLLEPRFKLSACNLMQRCLAISYYMKNAMPNAIKLKLIGVVNEVPRVHAAARQYNYLLIGAALRNGLRSRRPPELIHIHDHVVLTQAEELRAEYNVPLIWDAHEIYEDLAGLDNEIGVLNAQIIKDNVKHVDGFITINESIAEFYHGRYPELPRGIVVMNATAPEPVPEYDGRLHHAAGLSDSQKIVLFQGGFGPKRGLRELVRAASQFNDDWTLVLMGWGNLEDELRDLASKAPRESEQPDVVFLPGVPHDELQLWSAGASLGAIPYENTGLNHLYCTPNKLWEYPSAGVPILCTRLVELQRFIDTYGIGFLIPRDFTERDIATAVNEMDPQALARAKENCAPFIAQNNWDKFAPRLTSLYEQFKPAVSKRHEPELEHALRSGA